MISRPRALAVLFFSAGLAVAGCHRGSSTGSSSGNNPNSTGGTSPSNAGNASNSGNGGTEGQRKGEQPQAASDNGSRNQTHTEPDSREPVNSVSGKPSVASDNGSPAAVAHRSIAEPGAPEGTLNGQAARNTQKAQPTQPTH